MYTPTKETSMDDVKKWDSVAQNYQATYHKGQNDYNNMLIEFLGNNCGLTAESRVIDVGCGVGKYGVLLANMGCDVTLTDISPRMIEFARENMEKTGKAFSALCCDWSSVSIDRAEFHPKFDVAISTMSPAICGAASVKKLSDITRGFCFVTRFASWRSPLHDKLFEGLGMTKKSAFDNPVNDCEGLINDVKKAGYVPQVTYRDYCWADMRTPREVAERFVPRYFDKDYDENTIARAAAMAEEFAGENGMVLDAVDTKVSWVYWNTEEK